MKTILFRASLACVLGSTVFHPGRLAAQGQKPLPAQYTIQDVGTLGGNSSVAYDVNNAGRVSGGAAVAGGSLHAFKWDQGPVKDLGTLGGLNATAAGRAGRDELAIVSETAAIDPLAQDFCGFHTSSVCVAAVWRNGGMSPLPGLGGVNSAALTSNTQGVAIGLAEDGVHDGSCMAPQKTHFQATIWENGQIRVLPPLPGDEVGMALRVNDRGEVVGTTGLCSNTIFGGLGLGPHAVLWDHGMPINLGNLGDPNNAVAAAINNRGEIFGGAGAPDGSLHGFRWTKATGIQDIGRLSSDAADALNLPFTVNDSGEMVGSSCDSSFVYCRGYIWRDGQYTDLNTLLPADSSLYVLLPFGINEAGQITGLALDTNTFETHAFLMTPISGNGASAARTVNRQIALPENARKALQNRFPGGRVGAQTQSR
jgi:probable HAF family extracellular repeat protein